MAKGRIYTPYKKVIETLGLIQLDVYRVVDEEKKTPKDILRIYSPNPVKVVIVDLGAPREALSLSEFLEKIVTALEENKIPVPERILKKLRQELEKKEAQKAAA